MPYVARLNQNGRPRARRDRWWAKSLGFHGSSARRRVEHVEVLGVLGVGGPGDARVAVEQRAAVERGEQPLVRIDDEAVGALDAGEAVRGRSARRAPRRRRRRRRGTTCRSLGAHVGGAGEVVDRRRRSWCPHVATIANSRSRSVVVERVDASNAGAPRLMRTARRRRARARRRRPSHGPPARPTSGHPPTRPSGHGCGRGAPSARCRQRQRAATSALRLPAVPPLTNTPPAAAGSPARSAIQRSASFSANTAPAPSIHEPA